jgi:hypothetical protein
MEPAPNSPTMPQQIARIAAVTGVALTALGIGVIALGTALYDRGALAFPVLVQIAVLAGEVGLGMVPCIMLLNAARLVHKGGLTRAKSTSIAGGLVLLPYIGAAALFRMFANPCWDNPTCTGGSSFEDAVLKGGIIFLMLAAAVALLISPILLGVVHRSADQG